MMLLSLLSACTNPPDDGAEEPTELARLPDGSHRAAMSVGSFGGAVLPFQLDLETEITESGPRFVTFTLRAVDGARVSEVLAAAEDIPVSLRTGFVADLPTFTIPPDFSPTGSGVDVKATFLGEELTPIGFCGTIEGSIESFGLDLEDTTFGAVAVEEGVAAPVSCDAPPTRLPRLESCPDLLEGRNTFTSGGVDREVLITLPPSPPEGDGWPVAVVFHGIDQVIDDLAGPELLDAADARGVALVIPQGLDSSGPTSFDPLGPEGSNRDVVLFDDLVTCLPRSLSVDPARVHVTGFSGGALMAGTLAAVRSDVVASAAPLSGGITVAIPEDARGVPSLVVFGGPNDSMLGQDFARLAEDWILETERLGGFVAVCDHGLGHVLTTEIYPAVFEFFVDHPLDSTTSPYESGLPTTFPEYCSVR